VEGTVTFTDLLGEKLIAIKLIRDIKCPAGGTAMSSGSWRVGMFEGADEERMRTLSHDDVKATLTVQKAVFSDNTIWNASSQEQQ
jgi:hypothetical protein